MRHSGVIRKRHKRGDMSDFKKEFFCDLRSGSTCSLKRISLKKLITHLAVLALCILLYLQLAKAHCDTDNSGPGNQVDSAHTNYHNAKQSSRYNSVAGALIRQRREFAEDEEEQIPIQVGERNSHFQTKHSFVPYSTQINRIASRPKLPSSFGPTRQVSGSSSNSARSGRPVRSSRTGEQPVPRASALQAQQESSSQQTDAKCALILQRTYVKKVTNEGSSSTVDSLTGGNDLDSSNQLMATGKRERVCITYKEVNKAIALAKQRRQFTQVNEDEINSIEPSVPVIAELGELNQEVTKILQHKFDLSPDEILNGLTLIDMSRTDFWPICPLMVRPVRCDPTGRFRSFTGHCNNLRQPAWGAAQTPFVRYLAPKHPDGIQQERASVVDGSPLPSPRLVTSIVHRDHDQPSSDLSLLIMVWGQVIDHDVALAAPPRGK